MSTKTESTIESAEREFVITRVFVAPRPLVFKAWTDPQHMAQWWGPHTFTNPVCDMDVRPGGTFLIVMRGSDGSEFPFKGVYREIVPPERRVYTDDLADLPDEWHDLVNPNRENESAGKPALKSVTTVTFEDLNGETKLTIRTRFASVAVRDAMLKMQMAKGWSQSLERLEELLAKS